MAGLLYSVFDADGAYFFICTLRTSDGVATYCSSFNPGSHSEAHQLLLFGDYLLVHGYSTSSAFLANAWDTDSVFTLWINKDLKSDGCSALNVQEHSTLEWKDENLPLRSITLSDLLIED